MNSFIKWAGSKKQLLPVIIRQIPPDFYRYIEPFAGSARLFFQILPNRSVLGDINKELIDSYKIIKTNIDGVILELNKLKKSKEDYYKLRAVNPSELKKEASAARFIYLNRFCFNGLYRTNKQGIFNVPYGEEGYNKNSLPSADLLRSCSLALKNTKLICGSFEKTLSHSQAKDFIYLDPPYSVKARRVFNEYSNFNFGDEQIEKLSLHLQNLNKKNVYFMVSYAYSKEGLYLAQGFNKQIIFVKRNIAGFASNRRKAKEIIITNF